MCVEKAHHNARCDEAEWVAVPNIIQSMWDIRQIEKTVAWREKSSVGKENNYARTLVSGGFTRGRAPTIFYHPP